MKLIFMGAEYPCSRAEKDERKGRVRAYAENGSLLFEASKVIDFAPYALEGGEWAEAAPSDAERIAELEEALELLLSGETEDTYEA